MLIPEEPPNINPSCFSISNINFKASVSLTWKESSTITFSRFFVILPWPIPSVIEVPEDSNAPFLNYSPLVDNLQILDPLKSSAMNLLKPRGINAIVGTGIIAKLKPINDIRVGVQFTHAGLIGPQIGFNKVKALAEIKKEQKGWLDITYLSEELRICRGDKGTLFVLKKRSDERLFKRFRGFIEKISSKKED